MSPHHEFFQAIERLDITDSARALARYLLGYHLDGKSAFPGVRRICDRLKISESTYKNCRRALERAGFLRRIDRFCERTGRQMSNLFEITMFDLASSVDLPAKTDSREPKNAPTCPPTCPPLNNFLNNKSECVVSEFVDHPFGEAGAAGTGSTHADARAEKSHCINEILKSVFENELVEEFSIAEAVTNKAEKLQASGWRLAGRKIKNPVRYLAGMVRNWRFSPYKSQADYQTKCGDVDLPVYSPQKTVEFEASEIPF